MWSVVIEATDYKDGKVPMKTVITDPQDDYLAKMQGYGWMGYALVYRNKECVRSMHVSAPQARELIALAAAGEEPKL